MNQEENIMIKGFITDLASYQDLPTENEQHLLCRRQAWDSHNYVLPQSARPAMEHWKDPSKWVKGQKHIYIYYICLYIYKYIYIATQLTDSRTKGKPIKKSIWLVFLDKTSPNFSLKLQWSRDWLGSIKRELSGLMLMFCILIEVSVIKYIYFKVQQMTKICAVHCK